MTKPQIRIIDGDQITDREMTDDEFAAYEISQADNAKTEELQAAALAAKVIARQALLEKLGITEEEAQLLLGGI